MAVLERDMRIIARFEKGEGARYISHLDVQRLFQRAFRRADIPMAYSQGFNPHPLLSFATALTLGATSSAEWLDVKLEGEMTAEEFMRHTGPALPPGFMLHEVRAVEDKHPSLSAIMEAAEYRVKLRGADGVSREEMESVLERLLSGPIMVMKKGKAGVKETDLRPQLYAMEHIENGAFSLCGRLDAGGSLSVDLLMEAYCRELGMEAGYSLHRRAIYFAAGHGLPERPMAI